MLPMREYIYYGAVIGFIILGLATNVDLYWVAIGGVVGRDYWLYSLEA